VKDEWSKD